MMAAEIVEAGLRAASESLDHVSSSVIVRDSSSVNLRWACNTLTTNGVAGDRQISVVVAVSTRAGVAVASLTRTGDGSGVVEQVAAAAAQARSSPAAEDARDLVSGEVDADFADPAAATGPAALSVTADQLGGALEVFRSDGAELFGFVEHSATTTWLGTSTGLRRRHVQPTGTVEITGKSHGRSRSSYANRTTTDLGLVDVGALAEQVRTRLGWQARTVDVPPGRHDTILPPTSAADLMINLYWNADARSAVEGRSAFSMPGGGTRIGARLTEVGATLSSDPHRPGLEAIPFVATDASGPTASVFDNGLDLRSTTWVDHGRLTALPGNRHSAGLARTETCPGIDNLTLTVDTGSGSLDDVIAGTRRGLLVTSLWYIRDVDPMTLLLTGLTRDGVYLVENGEIVGVTSNFRFNDSPLDLLSRIEAAGSTDLALSREWADWFTRSAMPPLRVAGFNMSTQAKGT